MAEEANDSASSQRRLRHDAPLQEQLFESLKRTRDRLCAADGEHARDHDAEAVRSARVHVGVPEAIRVMRRRHGRERVRASLLERTRERMQEKLDEINARIAPDVARFSHPNVFVAESMRMRADG